MPSNSNHSLFTSLSLSLLVRFKLYDTEHVLAGRWGYCEDYIRPKVKEYGKKIQSLKKYKIVFGGFHPEEVYIISVDGVNFSVNEMRLDPR